MGILTLLAATADQVEADWANTFFGLNQEQRFVLMIIGIGCATGIIISANAIFSGLFGSIHRRRGEAELKRELIDRGMSAEEIAGIVEAAPPQDFLERWASCRKKK
jgi:hypothetical protein